MDILSMKSHDESYVIRPLKEDDCSQIMAMMLEMSDYLGDRHIVRNTQEGLRQDLFRQPIRCSGVAAELIDNGVSTNTLVGYILYYPAYSARRGMYMYVDNLFVRGNHRGRGVGRRLFQAVTQTAIDLDLNTVELIYKRDNEISKDFYKSLGMIDQSEIDGHLRMRMAREQMEILVKAKPKTKEIAARDPLLISSSFLSSMED